MLSRTSEYALRALSHLAEPPDGRWALNREIAEELELPPPYLAKILRELTTAGLLESQRGKHGGFRLTRSATDISVLEIVDPFDHFEGPSECLLGQARCSDALPCPLHDQWKDIFERFVSMLRSTTLAEIVQRKRDQGFPRPGPGPAWRQDGMSFLRT